MWSVAYRVADVKNGFRENLFAGHGGQAWVWEPRNSEKRSAVGGGGRDEQKILMGLMRWDLAAVAVEPGGGNVFPTEQLGDLVALGRGQVRNVNFLFGLRFGAEVAVENGVSDVGDVNHVFHCLVLSLFFVQPHIINITSIIQMSRKK